MSQQKYMTPEEVEGMFSIKQKTLANWRNQGKGPQYYKIGKVIRYLLEDLEKWAKAYRVRTVESA